MKLQTVSIFVDDQQRAADFYTQRLGFAIAADVPMGEHRWLTVVEAGTRDGRSATVVLRAVWRPPLANALLPDGVPITVTSTAAARFR